MDVKVEQPSGYGRRVTVTLEPKTVDMAFDQAFRAVRKTVQIPGFRAGKGPRHIIEKSYAMQILEDVRNILIDGSLEQALTEQKLAPVAQPRVHLGEVERGKEAQYVAEVEVMPEITLAKTDGLPAPELDLAVTDAAVDARLEDLRKRVATFEPVVGRTTASHGDVVTLNYLGSIDGVPFAGGAGKNAEVEIGGQDYIPGFAEGLLGSEVPSTVHVPVTFPADYPSKDLAGKEASFAMELMELKERKLPALDEDFAKDMGEADMVSLRAKLRASMEHNRAQEVKKARHDALLKALVEANPFDVPPSMVGGQLEEKVQEAQRQMQRISGTDVPLTPEQLNEIRGEGYEEAAFEVRAGLLLLEVAKANDLSISEDELTAAIADLVAKAPAQQQDQARAHYSDANRRNALRFSLLEDKSLAYLDSKSVLAPAGAAAPDKV